MSETLESTMQKPSQPMSYMSDWGRQLAEKRDDIFGPYIKELNSAQEMRDAYNRHAKNILEIVEAARIARESTDMNLFNTKMQEVSALAQSVAAMGRENTNSCAGDEEGLRPQRLADAMESVMRIQAYGHFLETGQLIPQSQCGHFSDDEYMGGVMSVVHDFARYATGRAIQQDTRSVLMARNVTEALQSELAKFDFRNGPLRRKFDAVKYAIKKLESILYDLAINDKRPKQDETEASVPFTPVVNTLEFDEIRKRFEKYDEQREFVIKKSRDIQKGAKQAIYSIHRQEFDRATKLLSGCKTVIDELLPIVQASPGLRMGSFTNSLEEYAEAILFQTWLVERRLLRQSELPFVNAEEYIGGICDLTGELGRFAVVRATQRDLAAVTQCLETDIVISLFIASLALPMKLIKKVEPLRTSISKLETVIYELSLAGQQSRPMLPSADE